jgi:hypothetical protein
MTDTSPEIDDTEGHSAKCFGSEVPLAPDSGDDTEGHGVHCSTSDVPASPDTEDTEGHNFKI